MTLISSGAISIRELQRIVCKYINESADKTDSYTECGYELQSFSNLKHLRFSGKYFTLLKRRKNLYWNSLCKYGVLGLWFHAYTFASSEFEKNDIFPTLNSPTKDSRLCDIDIYFKLYAYIEFILIIWEMYIFWNIF